MTPEEKTAATIVAMAGPLSLAQILRISGPKAVDALDTAGIIAVSTGHDRLVRAASPILGEIIRPAGPGRPQREPAFERVVASQGGAVLPDAFLNRLRWSLDSGVEIPPPQLLQAATRQRTTGPRDRAPRRGCRGQGPVPRRGANPAGLRPLHPGSHARPPRTWSPRSRCRTAARPTWPPSWPPGSDPRPQASRCRAGRVPANQPRRRRPAGQGGTHRGPCLRPSAR